MRCWLWPAPNAAKAGAANVEFLEGEIEALRCPIRRWMW